MKPRIVWILGAVLVVAFAVAGGDLCEKEDFEKCKTYPDGMAPPGSPVEKCKYLKEVARCDVEAAKDCELDSMLESVLKFMVSFDCDILQGTSNEDISCLGTVVLHIDTVMHNCQRSILSRIDMILQANDLMGRPESELSTDDLMCTFLSLTLECLKEAATEQCGEASGDLTLKILNEAVPYFLPENIREHLRNCNPIQDSASGSVDDYDDYDSYDLDQNSLEQDSPSGSVDDFSSNALDQNSQELSKRSDELELWYRKKRDISKRALVQYMNLKKRDMFGLNYNRKKRGWRGNSYSWKSG